MAKITMLSVGNHLEIERALTKQERNRILDAADQLLLVGGRSRDRHRHGGTTPPQRKSFRPYRNRAIIYTLIETGMRRTAITNLNLVDIDFDRRILAVVEKGGSVQPYPISRQGIAAIRDYLEQERGEDQIKWQAHALFLASSVSPGPPQIFSCENGETQIQFSRLLHLRLDACNSSRGATPCGLMGGHLA